MSYGTCPRGCGDSPHPGPCDPDGELYAQWAADQEAHTPTQRQKDILWRISEGYTDRMIAEALGIERSTVKDRLADLYTRIGVHTRAAAVAMALRQGWIR